MMLSSGTGPALIGAVDSLGPESTSRRFSQEKEKENGASTVASWCLLTVYESTSKSDRSREPGRFD